MANIWAIVPAHNEEKIIADTIKDLFYQTLPVKILVVLDNCTDKTQTIVKNLISFYPNLYFFKTKYNKKKKAGAVNQAIKSIETKKIDAVLLMDADTRIDRNAVEFGWERLNSDSNLAAVCSKAGVLPHNGRNPLGWILHRLQRLEYANFDSQRVETLGTIKVIHGMAAIHRWAPFMEAGYFDVDSIVEDYDLTLTYKELGYKVTTELKMLAWTDVPVSFKQLWTQRLRWHRGGVDALRKHGWNRVTRTEILQHFWVNFLLLFNWFFMAVFLVMILQGRVLLHGLVLLGMAFGLLANLYRLKYLENRSYIDYMFRLMVFPEMIYGILNSLNLYHSYYMFFRKKTQEW